MDYSAAASPVRPMSCKPLEPNLSSETTSGPSEPVNHLAHSLHMRPNVESDDEDNFVGQGLSPASNSDSSGHLSSSEDELEDSCLTGLSAWDALGECFEQDVADMGASNKLSIIQFFNLHFS